MPRQLPAPPRHFSGRRDEQKALTELLDETTGVIATATVVSVISGTAGIGKTALAVHWAHQVAARFPDGQLYVNLRGFDPAGDAGDAGRGGPRLPGRPRGTRPDRIPADRTPRPALYRSLLAGKRMLVVLDNARDADQVRPLLPGSPGCLVMVTSRNRLTGLVATDGATRSRLDVLSPGRGPRRCWPAAWAPTGWPAEPRRGRRADRACARLPLALAIAAARAAARPGLPLAALAAELRERTAGWTRWTPATRPATCAPCSPGPTRASSRARRRGCSGCWACIPGPDITGAGRGQPGRAAPGQAARRCGELSRAQPDRRAAARPLRPARPAAGLRRRAGPRATSPSTERAAPCTGMLDHYLHTAHAAAVRFNPARRPLTLPAAAPGPSPSRCPTSARPSAGSRPSGPCC